MRGGTALAVTGLLLLLATPCFATTVEPVQGDVSLNKPGHGFQQIAETTIVEPGDLVMVSPNGSANVFYADGCRFVVQPGAVLTIAAISPCASKSFAQAQPQTGLPGGPPPGSPFDDATAWGFGGAVLGLSGFIGYEISKSGKT